MKVCNTWSRNNEVFLGNVDVSCNIETCMNHLGFKTENNRMGTKLPTHKRGDRPQLWPVANPLCHRSCLSPFSATPVRPWPLLPVGLTVSLATVFVRTSSFRCVHLYSPFAFIAIVYSRGPFWIIAASIFSYQVKLQQVSLIQARTYVFHWSALTHVLQESVIHLPERARSIRDTLRSTDKWRRRKRDVRWTPVPALE